MLPEMYFNVILYRKEGGSFMKLKFTQQQYDLLKKLDISYDVRGNLSDGQILDMETVVTEYLVENGIEEDETVNAEGKICESILELLSDI